MNIRKTAEKVLYRLPEGLAARVFEWIKGVPAVRASIEKEMDEMMAHLRDSVKPYKGKVPEFSQMPDSGLEKESVLDIMRDLQEKENEKWRDGYVSGAVYHGDPEHIDFLNRVYAVHSQSNPLHADIWPSASKYEAEIVSMTADMLGAGRAEDEICGVVSSGGTESILLAMKTYRDQARQEKKNRRPELVVPVTAHAAFDKAARYFGIKIIHVPVKSDFTADAGAMKKACNRNTIAMAGSAPSFPHGVIDPIADLSEIAREKGIGFHTDACLGGFVLPWAEALGYGIAPFDFRLPGVTSMSADTHKYGYAAKGTSVVLYRGRHLRRYQYFTITDWPGGLYFSPTFAGSRPGALSAQCWAAMVKMGREGYMEATRQILETADKIKSGIREIPELSIYGDPLWVIAFGSETLNIYQVMEQMGKKGWALNGLHKPACVHIAVTLRHTGQGVAERFVADLKEAVAYVRAHPEEQGETAPVYGMAATIPFRGVVSDMLERYMDLLYSVE
ncbi:MAG: aminotransferase class V-fold PLP-dependent enzyme [Desulfobacterales bacterium]|nr:aminotransferase class V-fold PLP-dependent enzyme [Desulfobacterales bacterium]